MKLLSFLAAGLALAAQALGQVDEKARIREIGKRYEQIEAQLARSVHYVRKSEKDGATLTEQAWLTEARDLLKVSTESKGPAGRELVEIFIQESPFLVLERHERPLSDGSTQVSEQRSFYTQLALTRLLTKKATFPAGDPLDTVKVKNVTVDFSLYPERDRTSQPFAERATELVTSLAAAGPPEHDPGAGSPGDSARYRLIQKSTSPDGRLALGFGTAENPVPWKTLEDEVDEVTGYQHYSGRNNNVRNYLVDLTTHRILCETKCNYIATRARFGREANFITWSRKERFFVQTFEGRWSSEEAGAGWIDLEHGKAAATDLLAAATSQAYKFLAARKDPAYRKFGDKFAVSVSGDELLDDGTVRLQVSGEIPKSEEDHSSFSVVERFRIQEAGGRVKLQFIDVRRGE